MLHSHSVLRSEGLQGKAQQVSALTELMSHESTNTWIKILVSFTENLKHSNVIECNKEGVVTNIKLGGQLGHLKRRGWS